MAVLRTQITGPVRLPDGSTPPDGNKIIFTLTSWDKTDDAVIMHGPVEAQIESGAIDVSLHRVGTGLRQTAYRVDYVYHNAAARRWLTLSMGQIAPDGPGPYDLADLLAIPAPVPTVPDALAQALGAAATSSANAGLTAADRVQTGLDRSAAAASAATSALHLGNWQDGIPYRNGGGAARQTTDGGGWALVADANHDPYGITSLSVSGGNLVVTYDYTAVDVGTFSVTVDEGYAAIGLMVGASVGTGSATISGFAPISGRVVGGATGLAYSTTSGNVVSQTVDQPNGTIAITHLTQTHTDSNGSAVMVSPIGSATVGRLTVATQSKTAFTLQYCRDLACRIACTTTTPGSEVFTVSETLNTGISAAWISGTNCVRVTFPAAGNSNPDAVVMLSRDAPTRYLYTLDTQGSTTCDVFFYDTSGTLITAATSSMIFYLTKRGNFPAALPASGNLGFVQRDMIPVDFDHLNGATSNLWLGFSNPIAP